LSYEDDYEDCLILSCESL